MHLDIRGVMTVRYFLRIVVASTALFVSGCVGLKGTPDPPRSLQKAQADPAAIIDAARLKQYNATANPERKKQIRNEIVDERLLEIDHQFQLFSLELWKSETGTAVGVDWLQLALSGLTSTVGGVATKTALGVASTGLAGAKSSFDKNALFQKTLPAIMAQMVAEREKIRSQIIQRSQLSVTDYSLYAALSDLQRMINAGSIPGTIQVIAEDAGAKSALAASAIRNVQSAVFLKDLAGDKLRKFWKPDGKTIDTENEKKLKAWMGSNGLSTEPGSIELFLRNSKMAPLRMLAADELVNGG